MKGNQRPSQKFIEIHRKSIGLQLINDIVNLKIQNKIIETGHLHNTDELNQYASTEVFNATQQDTHTWGHILKQFITDM